MALPPLDYRPPIPRTALRIGIVGAGAIVRDAHLPAYAKAGFTVSAISDRRRAAAEELAGRFAIPSVVADALELVRRDDVDVVDVAVPDAGRLEIVEAAARHGKHLLVQKPLAHALEEARAMVAAAREGGVKLAVNQNARWAPEFRAARSLVRSGVLGDVYLARWEMRNHADSQPWARDSWYAREPRFQVLLWSIHHLDLARFWMGAEPEAVFCSLPRRPGQHFRGDVVATMVLGFPGRRQAVLVDNNASIPGRDVHQTFGLEGTAGVVEGDVAEPRRFEVRLAAAPETLHRPALEGAWYPDGFIGPMGDLLRAIESGGEPEVSGEDHLKTLQVVAACYRSAATQAVVEPASL